jgi:hypothetical protein
MKRKLLTETSVCPRERLVIISYITGLSIAKEKIRPLAAIVTTVFLFTRTYLFALSNTPENQFASIYSKILIKTTCQHLLLLVGFDTLIYRKYDDTPPILVGHQPALVLLLQDATPAWSSWTASHARSSSASKGPRRTGVGGGSNMAARNRSCLGLGLGCDTSPTYL